MTVTGTLPEPSVLVVDLLESMTSSGWSMEVRDVWTYLYTNPDTRRMGLCGPVWMLWVRFASFAGVDDRTNVGNATTPEAWRIGVGFNSMRI